MSMKIVIMIMEIGESPDLVCLLDLKSTPSLISYTLFALAFYCPLRVSLV